MAEILRRMESDSKVKIPASEVVNIDLEFTFFSREVLQIGVVGLEESNVFDYFPEYSEGVVVSFSSPLPAPPTWQQKAQKTESQSLFYARWDSWCKRGG